MKRKIITLLLTIFILTNTMTAFSASPQYPYIKYKDINKHWAAREILEMSALGYMKGNNDKFYPNRQLNYGELLTIAIRAIGKEGEAQAAEPKNHLKGIYQIAYDLELIEQDDKNKNQDKLIPAPSIKVTREEAANILGRALGIEPPSGHEITEAKKFTDYNKISNYRLPYVELLLQKGYMNGRSDKRLDPKGRITRGEFAKILSNANEDLIHHRNITKKIGQISNIELGEISIYNSDGTSNIIGYKDKNIFPVQKDKKLYTGDILKEEDFLTYYIDSNGKAIYGELNDKREITVEGTIREIDLNNREITVWDFNDKTHKIKLDPVIDMEQLYFEQEVAITTKGCQVVKLTTFNEEDPERDGYIIPGTRFRVGTVLMAKNDEIQIKTQSGIEKYKIDPLSTTLYKKEKRVELFQLKEGDRVLLKFDDIYSSQVAEIKIEDEEKHIAGVIKGKIELIDERNKEILLSEPSTFNQGMWNPSNSKLKVKLGTGPIYEGGRKLTLSNLQKRKGEEAYIAYETSYGTTSVSKMLLKSGPSMEYNDLLKDIDYGDGQMVLNTNSFRFHEGTIVIKDNRLVDPLNLDINQNLFLVSDYKNGVKGASFISIEGTTILDDRIDGTKLLVYKGKIEDILDYKLILGNNNYKLDKTTLTKAGFSISTRDDKLILTEDTLVYDSELGQSIPTKSFIDSRYIDLISVKDRSLRNRIEKGFYKNKPAYVIARQTGYGKEILSINLVPQDLNSYSNTVALDFSTLGQIESVDQDNKTMNISKVQNYNTLTGKWEKGVDETLNLNKAVILVNDKPIPLEELYKLRTNSKVYLIRHKDSSIDIPYILLIED